MTDMIASFLNVDRRKRQEILELLDVETRMEKLLFF